MKRFLALALAAVLCFASVEASASQVFKDRSAVAVVASGQTSVAMTWRGIRSWPGTRCVASITNATTNAVYVRSVATVANSVTVTLSGDPGASGANLSIFCKY